MIHETTMSNEHVVTFSQEEWEELLDLIGGSGELQPDLIGLINDLRNDNYHEGILDGRYDILGRGY